MMVLMTRNQVMMQRLKKKYLYMIVKQQPIKLLVHKVALGNGCSHLEQQRSGLLRRYRLVAD